MSPSSNLAVLFGILSLCIGFPVFRKREDYGQYRTSIQTIHYDSPQYNTSGLAHQFATNLANLFYSESTNNWSDNCANSAVPVVWQVAVAGKVMTNTKRSDYLSIATTALSNYRNSTGGYSASTAKNADIYTDDNAQIAWVFSAAYENTGREEYLDEHRNITDFLALYEDESQGGGILWTINGNYIASISTLETAVAAAQLCKHTGDTDYCQLAKDCITWTLDHLIDQNDKFIMDGLSEDGGVNGGKLTYTFGTLISACAYLSQMGDLDQDWKAIAVEFGVRLLAGGRFDNQFFDQNGHMNDIIDRSHLVFVGFADLLEFTTPVGSYQEDAYNLFNDFVIRESRHFHDTYQNLINGTCPGNEYNSLLKYASLAQVFQEASRVSDYI